MCKAVCSVSGWLQWPPQPHRRTSRCPRRRCRSQHPASCLHSEGVLHTRPGLLGPLLHIREEEPGVPAGGTGCRVPAFDPHQTSASCSSTWSEGPMATTQVDAGNVVAPSMGALQAFSQGSGPRAGEGPGGLVRPRRGCPTLGTCVPTCMSPCSAVHIPGLRIA